MSAFNTIVEKSHLKWMSQQKNPLKTISQGFVLPKTYSNKILVSILNHLPDYIPENLKEKIRSSHKELLIVVSLIADKRSSYELGESYILLDEEDEIDGRIVELNGLTEQAVHSLTKDILVNLVKSQTISLWLRIFIFLAYLTSKVLVISPKTQNQNTQNIVLGSLGNSIDLTFHAKKSSTFWKLIQAFIYKSTQNANLVKRIPYSLITGGAYYTHFPGIVHIHCLTFWFSLLSWLLNSACSFSLLILGRLDLIGIVLWLFTLLIVVFNVSSLIMVLVHETCHYITHDIDKIAYFNIVSTGSIENREINLETNL